MKTLELDQLGPGFSLPVLLAAVEFKYLCGALYQTKGNKSEAAKLLGIDRSTLRGKLRKHGLDKTKDWT